MHYLFSGSFIFILYSIGGLFTLFYSINLYYFIFLLFNYGILFDYYHYSSFIFIWYAISCIFIDQCFNCIFSICSLYSLFLGNMENIFYSSVLFWCYGFISISYLLCVLSYIILYIYFIHLDYSYYRGYNAKYWHLYNYLLDYRSSFMVSVFGLYGIFIIAIYIFMPIIHILELFIGIDSGSIYVLVYYHFSLIIWGIIIYLWIMVLLL